MADAASLRHVAALARGGPRRLVHPLRVPVRELYVLRRVLRDELLVSGQAPQERPGPDAALQHEQVLVDSAPRLLGKRLPWEYGGCLRGVAGDSHFVNCRLPLFGWAVMGKQPASAMRKITRLRYSYSPA